MVDLNPLVFYMIMTCDEKFENYMIIGLEVRIIQPLFQLFSLIKRTKNQNISKNGSKLKTTPLFSLQSLVPKEINDIYRKLILKM